MAGRRIFNSSWRTVKLTLVSSTWRCPKSKLCMLSIWKRVRSRFQFSQYHENQCNFYFRMPHSCWWAHPLSIPEYDVWFIAAAPQSFALTEFSPRPLCRNTSYLRIKYVSPSHIRCGWTSVKLPNSLWNSSSSTWQQCNLVQHLIATSPPVRRSESCISISMTDLILWTMANWTVFGVWVLSMLAVLFSASNPTYRPTLWGFSSFRVFNVANTFSSFSTSTSWASMVNPRWLTSVGVEGTMQCAILKCIANVMVNGA